LDAESPILEPLLHDFSNRAWILNHEPSPHHCLQNTSLIEEIRRGAYRRVFSAVAPFSKLASAFDLSRDGLEPASCPTDPDPGSIAGERGAVARPMSEVPGETCDLTVASRMPWLIHPSQELVGAGVIPDDPGTAA